MEQPPQYLCCSPYQLIINENVKKQITEISLLLFSLIAPIEAIFLNRPFFKTGKYQVSRFCINGNLQNCKGDIFDMNI